MKQKNDRSLDEAKVKISVLMNWKYEVQMNLEEFLDKPDVLVSLDKMSVPLVYPKFLLPRISCCFRVILNSVSI